MENQARLNSRVEHMLDLVGTIRRLEDSLGVETDPRARVDTLSTISMLDTALKNELQKFAKEWMRVA